ncbi:hypothetical protein Gpo141_00004999 [Globisporangium polare]
MKIRAALGWLARDVAIARAGLTGLKMTTTNIEIVDQYEKAVRCLSPGMQDARVPLINRATHYGVLNHIQECLEAN